MAHVVESWGSMGETQALRRLLLPSIREHQDEGWVERSEPRAR